MSELTRCNYCTIKLLKEQYGKNLIQKGNNFYIPNEKGKDTVNGKKVKFIAWFMEITDHCVC